MRAERRKKLEKNFQILPARRIIMHVFKIIPKMDYCHIILKFFNFFLNFDYGRMHLAVNSFVVSRGEVALVRAEVIYSFNKLKSSFYAFITPFDFLLRRCQRHKEESCSIYAIFACYLILGYYISP